MLKKTFATAAVLCLLTVSPASVGAQEKGPPPSATPTVPTAEDPTADANGAVVSDAGKTAADNRTATTSDSFSTGRQPYYVYPRNYAKNYGRPYYRYGRVSPYYYGGGYPRGYPLGLGGVNPNMGNSSLNYGNTGWNYGNSWLNYGNAW
jgi:hypothetical protein